MLIHGILAPSFSSKLERQNHHSISLPFTLPACLPLSLSLTSQNTQNPIYSLQFFLLHLFFIKETHRAFLICYLKLEMKTMANGLTLIFLLSFLLLLSRAEARSMPAASILPESDPNASSSNIPIRSSPIVSSLLIPSPINLLLIHKIRNMVLVTSLFLKFLTLLWSLFSNL